MRHADERRFEDFFEEGRYVALKNYLYNYLLRKRLISATVAELHPRMTLEVGSGLSPMITNADNVVYSELSHRALCTLRAQHGRGHYVVADCTQLPFRDGAFGATVCSEVLEHVENDQMAIAELARVMEPGGSACITVPHRTFYYAADDRFVRHFRRYETADITGKLEAAGLQPKAIKKVLGPLEKVVMFSTVMLFSAIERATRSGSRGGPSVFAPPVVTAFKWANRCMAGLAWLDAKIMPRALATVIFVRATRP
jgi:SAM-dependent methyltransferase